MRLQISKLGAKSVNEVTSTFDFDSSTTVRSLLQSLNLSDTSEWKFLNVPTTPTDKVHAIYVLPSALDETLSSMGFCDNAKYIFV